MSKDMMNELKENLIDFCYLHGCYYNESYALENDKTYFGIICNNPLETLVMLCDFLRDCYSEITDKLGTPCIADIDKDSNKGMSSIIYFPNLRFDKEA